MHVCVGGVCGPSLGVVYSDHTNHLKPEPPWPKPNPNSGIILCLVIVKLLECWAGWQPPGSWPRLYISQSGNYGSPPQCKIWCVVVVGVYACVFGVWGERVGVAWSLPHVYIPTHTSTRAPQPPPPKKQVLADAHLDRRGDGCQVRALLLPPGLLGPLRRLGALPLLALVRIPNSLCVSVCMCVCTTIMMNQASQPC